MDENNVLIRGRLGDNPDISEKVATIKVATNKYWRDASGAQKSSTTWVPVVLFGKNIAIASAYLRKGTSVRIKAHVETSSWTDKGSGEIRSKLEIIADEIAIIPIVDANDAADQVDQPAMEQQRSYQQEPTRTYAQPEQPPAQQPSQSVQPRRTGMPLRRPVARPAGQQQPVQQNAAQATKASPVGAPPPPPRLDQRQQRQMPPARDLVPTVDGKPVQF
jgi:single-strand DNA-binding protein